MKKIPVLVALAVALAALTVGVAAGGLLKGRSQADLVRLKDGDGQAYIEFPAQIQANGSWTGVQVSVQVEVWTRVSEMLTTVEGH